MSAPEPKRLTLDEWCERYGTSPIPDPTDGQVLAVRRGDTEFWVEYKQWVVRYDLEPADVSYIQVTTYPRDVVDAYGEPLVRVGEKGEWAFFAGGALAIGKARGAR